ncbi:hypothetical protein llap_1253 [Limosa lapponica baueri]|uniref:Uncharacterized protein n=1 Tax=Limosa lapponica baueri TaxID=1758121 RepID=A0A2I0UQV9_LIMLA|nr:hypothetical protein llap_1253 [Limosa lapponica baueri]
MRSAAGGRKEKPPGGKPQPRHGHDVTIKQEIPLNKNIFGVSLVGMFQRKSKQALGELFNVEIVAGNVLVARKGKVREEAVEYSDI